MTCKKIVNSCLLGGITALVYHTSANALTFNFTYGNGVTYEQKVATELAGKVWSNYLADPVTVNIHLEMASSSKFPASNIIGGAIPFWKMNHSYSDFRNKLIEDKTTTDDNKATASLDTGSSWNSYKTTTWQELSSNEINLTRANAKAIGAIGANNSTLDGLILMNKLDNTGVSWQYNYLSSSVGTSKLDYTSVLIHEIGHILGFVSALDISNYNDYNFCGCNLTDAFTPMDMFRYDSTPWGVYRILEYGWLDSQYLSIDGGATALATIAPGRWTSSYLFQDYYQASHWQNDIDGRMMDPILGLNARAYLSNNSVDLRVFDAIGWDKQSSSKSLSTLKTEAENIADDKGNVNRNQTLSNMFQQYGWGGRSSSSTLGQEGDLSAFLNQQGFFQVGSFWETFDGDINAQASAVPESSNNIALIAGGLLALGISFNRKKNA